MKNRDATQDPTIPLLGIYPKKTPVQTHMCTHAGLDSQDMEATCVLLVNGWVEKTWYTIEC